MLGIVTRFLIVGRGLAVTGFEALGEIGGGGETGLVHYLGDGVAALLQKGGGGLQTDVTDELGRTQAGELLDLTVDLLGGPVGFFAEGGGGEVRIVKVTLDDVGDLPHKLGIRRAAGIT